MIPDAELATLLSEMNSKSVGYLTDQVSADQDDNLDRYLGKPYGDEEEGSSNAVSMDVAEVVDWAMPDLLEPFLAGERVVEFTPSKQADEEYCEQAGDLANYCFYSENPGVIVLHDTIKTACIQKIGIIKTWWHEEEVEERQTLTGLAKTNVEELSAEDGVTIEEEAGEPLNAELIPPEALAAFEDGQVYTVTIVRQKKVGRPCLESVPPEEFKVSQRAKNLDKVDYLCHETEVSRSALIAMGFDYDTVMGLAANKGGDADSRKDHRFSDEQRQEEGKRAKLSDTLTLCEEYPLMDLDGSGKAKRWQVFRVNKTILDKDEIDCHPFDSWSADRIPHRLIGLGLADKVKQTQYVKTHLTRGLLNNVYLSNQPRFEIPDAAVGDNTIEDLLTYRIGGLIRTKQPGMMQPIAVPDVSASALQAITYMDSVREQQSGITRNGMSISSEVVDPKSATEARTQDRNEQSRKRLMVRMIAETLLVPVFRKILKLLVKYQDAEKTIYLSGKWVTMDPRTWSADLKATVAVGLGHANSEEDLMAAQIVGQAQQMGAEAGLVGPEQLYETGKKLIRAVGWKFPEKYFKDPSTPQFQQEQQAKAQQPDPKMAEVQGKLKLKEMEMQMDAQFESIKSQRDLQIEMLKAEAKMAIEKEKVGFDFQAKLIQINAEFKLKQQQMFMEFNLQRQQMGFEARMAEDQQTIDAHNENRRIENQHEQGMTKAKNSMKAVKFGGKVG